MFGYGKMSGCAVAAMSALAEVFPEGSMLSSQQIAENRNLSQPLVAKILSLLSQHGLVLGTRGPGGGYKLARDPATISIYEVVHLFDGHRDSSLCPFGPGWCGTGPHCPMHDALTVLHESTADSLRGITLSIFSKNPKMG